MNTTDYTQPQADLDQLYVSCYDYGYSLEGLTLPGQNISRARSTSSRAASKTSTVADTSPTTSVSALTSVSASTSTSGTTILSSGASSASSGTSTSANGTASSPPSTPSNSDSSAALRLSIGGSGAWALVAAAIGLIVLWNN
ncbi:hypothetical protein BDR03DRAFT_981499 [Suillus americanus]|nr:hypothetical protein BDR03DRAFT_981499 [Suillus americanus]